MDNPVKINVNITDTINPYNIFINIRNSDNYEFNNLYLFIDIASPLQATERDTFECILADPNTGRWLGRGLGDIWDNKIAFKHDVRFAHKGDYHFTITQGMRIDKLPAIMDAGLSIERSKSSRNEMNTRKP